MLNIIQIEFSEDTDVVVELRGNIIECINQRYDKSNMQIVLSHCPFHGMQMRL